MGPDDTTTIFNTLTIVVHRPPRGYLDWHIRDSFHPPAVMVSFTHLAVLVALSSSYRQNQSTIVGVNGFIPKTANTNTMPYSAARQMVAQPIEVNGKTAEDVTSEE